MQGFRKPALLNSLFELEDNHDNNNLTNSNSSYFIQEVEVLEPKECSLMQLMTELGGLKECVLTVQPPKLHQTTAVKYRPVRVKQTPYQYQCSACRYRAGYYAVKAHIKKDHEDCEPWSCDSDNCHYKTYNEACQKVHMLHCTKSRTGKPFACSSCPFVTSRKYDFNRHIISHNRKKPNVCKKCGNRYKHKQGLKRHEMIHK